MKKSVLSQYEKGSAEQVLAHAVWQRSRGRNPSMCFAGERNPHKALLFARFVVFGAKKTSLINSLGAAVIKQGKPYYAMTDIEIRFAVRYIITSSSSKEEVQQRLRDELGSPCDALLQVAVPDNAGEREARELFRGLGGLVMKNGAMVLAMIFGNHGIILV